MLGLTYLDSMACAAECATLQDDAHGYATSRWDTPDDAADTDIQSWNRDEREEPLDWSGDKTKHDGMTG